MLINPNAGNLTHKGQLKKRIKDLQHWQLWEAAGATLNPNLNVQLHLTESMDHAQDKALQLVKHLCEDQWSEKKVILLAGGDGFHKDVCTALMRFDPSIFETIYLFRLPLGTGNDASDCETLSDACRILKGPVKEVRKSCLSIQAKGLEEDFCFNIASVGLDAYVCELTEKWKGRLPGDIYKIMVDLSVLLYDKKYPIASSKIKLKNKNTTEEIEGPLLLTLMGCEGFSTYGGKKKILPNEKNVLLTENIPLLKRIKLKGHFMKGTHEKFPISRFFEADSLTLEYPENLLMQLDGEVTPLKKDNFPLVFQRISQVIRTFS